MATDLQFSFAAGTEDTNVSTEFSDSEGHDDKNSSNNQEAIRSYHASSIPKRAQGNSQSRSDQEIALELTGLTFLFTYCDNSANIYRFEQKS